ncbi:uncharacterized protein L3040_005289 [Drepanopeziza brunnea f. sp. 'multigermtubi']|uniref:Ecp7(P20) n=2 Tax=Drepanopeziza brunnea f. sp. 'multigermtubi' TaxID=698441 RepID=D2XTB9_9HELO|nr:putative Ecp7(P20) [Drepanopeziza brunnea f. sp. 'multigermtubi' MB_m1]ADB23418.1 Ecp7(P20) [Drepanopeziza brunnea f. sp. 'multigermtubi']AFS30720.1 LysM02p [Drepanopeziza brunnea f. sp. 'multigermtubi']EKD21779.1 putative Ecp7(P20) [Drepanopeziza brunnea f. sp. 'multigermtubi' MB_m1]KAJ5041719.1 hypothetical protein L3040_005289 [Drepanopeziza brunnea f. sp. 'multigermtubi']
MRFNNNFLIASFLGVATALRRGCSPDINSGSPMAAGTGFYTIVESDTIEIVAADFCTDVPTLERINHYPEATFSKGNIYRVPCRARNRDCARIQGSDKGYYTINEGDMLKGIAEDFCTSTENLEALNPDLIKFAPDDMPLGDRLKVPCSWN